MTENEQINVLIKDGNRTVNWDYPPSKTIGTILAETGFHPVWGTVRVGGEEIEMMNIGSRRLLNCPQEITPDRKMTRVVITLESIRPEKTLKERKKEGGSADVR